MGPAAPWTTAPGAPLRHSPGAAQGRNARQDKNAQRQQEEQLILEQLKGMPTSDDGAPAVSPAANGLTAQQWARSEEKKGNAEIIRSLRRSIACTEDDAERQILQQMLDKRVASAHGDLSPSNRYEQALKDAAAAYAKQSRVKRHLEEVQRQLSEADLLAEAAGPSGPPRTAAAHPRPRHPGPPSGNGCAIRRGCTGRSCSRGS